MTRNVEVLNRAADWFDAHPGLHVQDHWAVETECGTAYCVAGTVAMLNGWAPLAFKRRIPSGILGASYEWVRDDLIVDVATVATMVMDLEVYEADLLFSPDWQPAEGLTVADALRRLANGASLLAVTHSSIRDPYLDDSEDCGLSQLAQEYLAEMKAHA